MTTLPLIVPAASLIPSGENTRDVISLRFGDSALDCIVPMSHNVTIPSSPLLPLASVLPSEENATVLAPPSSGCFFNSLIVATSIPEWGTKYQYAAVAIMPIKRTPKTPMTIWGYDFSNSVSDRRGAGTGPGTGGGWTGAGG